MQAGEPKFRRRKADRPAEIVAAAMSVFAEKGFAAARLDEIAARAGVSKGALYLYFETKEDLFRAVIEVGLAPNIRVVRQMIAAHPGPISQLLGAIPDRMAALVEAFPVGGVVKMVIGESRNFPELARLWHDELVSQLLGALCDAIAAAQGRGEIRAGDPRTFALQFVAPMLMSVIWRETFVPTGAEPFDIRSVARQHVETMLRGMAPEEPAR